MQEYAVATHAILICGNDEITAGQLFCALDDICFLGFAPSVQWAILDQPYLLHHLRVTLKVAEKEKNNLPVLLLQRHRGFKATDLRDNIYALSGLACDLGNDCAIKVEIDYDQPAEEIYRSVGIQIAQCSTISNF